VLQVPIKARKKRIPLRATLLLLLTASVVRLARSQSPAITVNPDGSVTIDAARLTTVVELNAPWRFSPEDNPAFADPSFDDSTWPLLAPGKNRSFSAAHLPNVLGGREWARLHLHIIHAGRQLAISLVTRNSAPYAVLLNGELIGATKGFESKTAYADQPFSIKLPPVEDAVLAVHFVHPRSPVVHNFPLESVLTGDADSLGEKIELQHYRSFDRFGLSHVMLGVLYLALVPFSLALLRAQPEHSEYLWLAITCSCLGLGALLIMSIRYGLLPQQDSLLNLASSLETVWTVACLEFVVALAGDLRGRASRLIKLLLLLALPLWFMNLIVAVRIQHSRSDALDHPCRFYSSAGLSA